MNGSDMREAFGYALLFSFTALFCYMVTLAIAFVADLII